MVVRAKNIYREIRGPADEMSAGLIIVCNAFVTHYGL